MTVQQKLILEIYAMLSNRGIIDDDKYFNDLRKSNFPFIDLEQYSTEIAEKILDNKYIYEFQ